MSEFSNQPRPLEQLNSSSIQPVEQGQLAERDCCRIDSQSALPSRAEFVPHNAPRSLAARLAGPLVTCAALFSGSVGTSDAKAAPIIPEANTNATSTFTGNAGSGLSDLSMPTVTPYGGGSAYTPSSYPAQMSATQEPRLQMVDTSTVKLATAEEALSKLEKKELSTTGIIERQTASGLWNYEFRGATLDTMSKRYELNGVQDRQEHWKFLAALDRLGCKWTNENEVKAAEKAREMEVVQLKAAGIRVVIGTVLTVLMSAGWGLYLRERRERRQGGGNGSGAGAVSNSRPSTGSARGAISSFFYPNQKKAAAAGFTNKQGGKRVLLEDIGGCPDHVHKLRSLVDDIRESTKGNREIVLPRGVIFYGPPGTGKTLSARAIAGEIDCPFISTGAGELKKSVYQGAWAASFLEFMSQARAARDEMTKDLRSRRGATGQEQGVAILFIDEICAALQRRTDGMRTITTNSSQDDLVTVILDQMDNINPELNRNIIVMGATNRFESIDSALLRPGRFDRQYEVPPPVTREDRLDVLQKLKPRYIKEPLVLESEDDLKFIAHLTPHKSGAVLEGILEEASTMARRTQKTVITRSDLIDGYLNKEVGYLKPNSIPEHKHQLISYHEHGHIIGGIAVGAEPLLMTMRQRGRAGGLAACDVEAVLSPPYSRRELLCKALITACGRSAERFVYGESDISDGAGQDLKEIRSLFIHMVSNGLLGKRYTLDLSSMPQESWPKEIVDELDNYVEATIHAGVALMTAVSRETLDTMMKESIALQKDLAGPEAADFYRTYLNSDIREALRKIVTEFTTQPLTYLPAGASPSATRASI